MNSAITLLTVSFATATPEPDIVERTMSLRTLAQVSSSLIFVAGSTLFTRAQLRAGTMRNHIPRGMPRCKFMHDARGSPSGNFPCAALKRAGAARDSLRQQQRRGCGVGLLATTTQRELLCRIPVPKLGETECMIRSQTTKKSQSWQLGGPLKKMR